MTNRNYLGGRRWARLRRRILDRDKWRCQECGAAARLHIDHVLREKAGGARFDEGNLQALCVRCHQNKTRRENSAPLSQDQLDWQRFLNRGTLSFSRHEQIYRSDV